MGCSTTTLYEEDSPTRHSNNPRREGKLSTSFSAVEEKIMKGRAVSQD